MADIVKQGGGDQFIAGPIPLGQNSALQHMLRHGHRLAQIGFGPSPLEYVGNEGDDRVAIESRLAHCRLSFLLDRCKRRQ